MDSYDVTMPTSRDAEVGQALLIALATEAGADPAYLCPDELGADVIARLPADGPKTWDEMCAALGRGDVAVTIAVRQVLGLPVIA